MFETATVIETDDGWATIRVQRSLACQGCNACGYSTANHMMVGRARNTAGALPGDCVRVEVATSRVAAVATTVYVIPLATMIAGYVVASLIGGSSAVGALGGMIGLGLGFWLVKIVGARLGRSQAIEPVVRDIIRRNPDREV